MEDRNPSGFWSNDYLHLVLMPTEGCNFRCVYCYESFEKGRARPEVVSGVKNLLLRRVPRLRRLSLSWFGGEPLLAVDIVREVSGYLQGLLARSPAPVCSADMTTNAYLLRPELLEELLDLGITDYQITLDGPRPVHDRRRLRANGEGSFERIWNHLCGARALPSRFRILLRVHVDRENLESMDELIDACAREFGGDSRYEIVFKLVGRWGGANDERLRTFGSGEEGRILEPLRARARASGLAVSRPRMEVCYAARPNSFVIRSDGTVGKCTVALDHPANRVGRLHPDGRLELDPDAMMSWISAVWSDDPAERRCPLKNLAARGSVENAGRREEANV